MRSQPTECVVTPVGNEIVALPAFYERMKKCIEPRDCVWIVVFDDFCKDGSYNWMTEHKLENIVIKHMGSVGGLARSYIFGNRTAIDMGANKIMELDIGHPIEVIPTFFSLLDKYPLVVGSRNNLWTSKNKPFSRKVISCCGNILSKIILNLPFSDCTSGLQAFTRELAIRLPWTTFLSTGYFYQTEFKNYCSKMPFFEVPFYYEGGEGKIKTEQILESLNLLFKLRSKNKLENLSR
jgi:hypothetical protein